MHTAHPYLPPTHLYTLMSTVSYWEVKTLGRKNLLQAVTLTATVGQKHVSSLVLRQQLKVLIYGVPCPHSVLLQRRDISNPKSQPATRAPPQVLLASLGESVQLTAQEQLNLLCSSTGSTPEAFVFPWYTKGPT